MTSSAAAFTHRPSLCSQKEGERFVAMLRPAALQGHSSVDEVGNRRCRAAAASFLLGAEEGCSLGERKVTGRGGWVKAGGQKRLATRRPGPGSRIFLQALWASLMLEQKTKALHGRSCLPVPPTSGLHSTRARRPATFWIKEC